VAISTYAVISGLKVNSTNGYSLQLTQASFNVSCGKISVTVLTLSLFEHIEISYIIVTSTLITSTVITSTEIVNYAYYFRSITTITTTTQIDKIIAFNGIGQLTCTGSACPNKCISKKDCNTYSGVILNNVCYICGTG
jgi:hypothetical protein